MPKIQIIITCINLWDKYTFPCINSVQMACQDIDDYRILLIDNASNDATQQEAGKLVSNHFAHKRNEERWSCSQSWNWGIRDAFERGYEYVLVLNNDVLMNPFSIRKLMQRMETAKDADILAMVTCMDATGECNIPNAIFGLKPSDKELVPETEHPCFSGFMINKLCWDKVGEFDENFKPAYYEDNDYHYRINLAKLKAIVVPTSMFYHYGSRTNAEAYDRPFIDSSINHRYYVTKWGGNPGEEKYEKPFNK